MMKWLAASAMTIAAMAISTPSSALEGCTCASMAAPGTAILGTIEQASGPVSSQAGKAEAGHQLKAGSLISTGEKAYASLSAGPCAIQMPALSQVEITQTGPDVCMRLTEQGQFISAEQYAGVLPGESTGSSSQFNRDPFIITFLNTVVPPIVIGSITLGVLEVTEIIDIYGDDDGPGCVSQC